MSITPPRRRHLGLGIAGLAAATGVVAVLAAPSAQATVDQIAVSGSDYKVGSTYTLSADLSGASIGLLVYWNDNGTSLSPAGKVPWPPGHASLDWTPKTAGQHVLTASQGSSTKSVVVNVSDGTTPPTTTVPPTIEPPTTTAPPTTAPPTTTEPPVTTTPPTTVPATTNPPVTTTPPITTKPSGGSGSADGLLPFGL
ncbi:hypothetical protein AB0N05_04265 [Nocardia sp. NPDC051030]|uniref:hypothetical protein n=1 Tax=Nocardia sp. NPDC051030 TaxID=3155162 RepID=UPI0034323252